MPSHDLSEIEARIAALRSGSPTPAEAVAARDRIIDVLLDKVRAGAGRDGEAAADRGAEAAAGASANVLSDFTYRPEQMKLGERLAALGFWTRDLAGDRPQWSEGLFEIFGLDPADGQPTYEEYVAMIHPDDVHIEIGAREAVFETGRYDVEFRVFRADGELRLFSNRGILVRDEAGRPVRIVGAVLDLTDQRQNEARLRQREAQLRLIADNMPALIAYVGHDLRLQFVNATARQWYARPVREIVGHTPQEIFGAEQYAKMRPHIERALSGRTATFEIEMAYPDGVRRFVGSSYVPDVGEDGAVNGYFALAVDLTERKRMEEALRQSEQRARDFAAIGSDWLWETDADFRLTHIGGSGHVFAAGPEDGALGMTLWQAAGADVEGEASWRAYRDLMRSRRPFRNAEVELTQPDGVVRHLRSNGQPMYDADGGFRGYRGVTVDVTGEVRARREAERATVLLLDAIDNFPDGIAFFDAADRLAYMNGHYLKLSGGRMAGEMRGLSFEEITRRRLERGELPDADGREEEWLQARMAYRRRPQGAFRIRVRTDRLRTYDIYESRTPDGGSLSIYLDVSEAVEQEERLQRMQRLQALGTLVGGLAHEMNNLLQPIGGLADVARRGIDDRQIVEPALEGISSASAKANQILQGMLAFGRRDRLGGGTTDLNAALADAMAIVLPAMPPAAEIRCEAEADLGAARIDGTEFLQVVMNLVKNAADAIGGAGVVSVTLARQDAGKARGAGPPFALLTVVDEGPGIPDGAQDRIFEPFFTTKEVGKGAGLGLSVVHSIVTDWGGEVRARNLEGGGAAFEVSIPLAAEDAG